MGSVLKSCSILRMDGLVLCCVDGASPVPAGLQHLTLLQTASPGAGALPEYNEAVVLVSTRLSEVRGFSDFFTGTHPASTQTGHESDFDAWLPYVVPIWRLMAVASLAGCCGMLQQMWRVHQECVPPSDQQLQ